MVFGVEIAGSLLMAAGLHRARRGRVPALGYVLASFTKTEDAANGMTQVVQFPMMFLSGMFFPIEAMPPFLQAIARLIPLTYLADALRQVMVGGVAVRAALGVRGRAARLAGRLLRDRVAQVPLAVAPDRARRVASAAYQRSSWTISSSGDPAAGLRRPREVGRVGRVAEREQVLAVVVGRVAEELARQVVVVDGRRHAADAELPGGQHHVLGRLPEVEHDRERRVGGRAGPASRGRPRPPRRRGARPTARPSRARAGARGRGRR